MPRFDETRLFNQPIEVEWAGFRSDTLRMQSAGWKVSAEQDFRRMTMTLAFSMENPNDPNSGIFMISREQKWEYMDREFHRRIEPLRLVGASRNIQFNIMGPVPANNWFAVDARPELAEVNRVDIRDMCHFRIPKDIIVPQDCVSDLLERALKVQQPIRDDEMIRRARKVHGSIITLA